MKRPEQLAQWMTMHRRWNKLAVLNSKTTEHTAAKRSLMAAPAWAVASLALLLLLLLSSCSETHQAPPSFLIELVRGETRLNGEVLLPIDVRLLTTTAFQDHPDLEIEVRLGEGSNYRHLAQIVCGLPPSEGSLILVPEVRGNPEAPMVELPYGRAWMVIDERGLYVTNPAGRIPNLRRVPTVEEVASWASALVESEGDQPFFVAADGDEVRVKEIVRALRKSGAHSIYTLADEVAGGLP